MRVEEVREAYCTSVHTVSCRMKQLPDVSCTLYKVLIVYYKAQYREARTLNDAMTEALCSISVNTG